MIITASIIEFEPKYYEDLKDLINKYENIEISNEDKSQGKMVITIEAENNKEIEDLEEVFKSCDYVLEFNHHAFYFGDEVEKAKETGIIPDFDLKKPFSKKKIL